MIIVNIYDNQFGGEENKPLVRLFERDVTGVVYENSINQVGYAQFNLSLENSKTTSDILEHYNRVEIVIDKVVKFTGYINYKRVINNTVSVRCKSLVGILQKRVLGNFFHLNGSADDFLRDLLNSVNNHQDTGIKIGKLNTGKSVNKGFQDVTILGIIQNITRTLNAQFDVNTKREFNFRQFTGEDLTKSVVFKHDYIRPETNNLATVEFEDDGEKIVTAVVSRTSDGLSSGFENTPNRQRYGLLEKFLNLSGSFSQDDLDQTTQSFLEGNIYTVSLSIRPDEPDVFDVGDFVRVFIRNRLTTIDRNYQVLKKVVQYNGDGQLIRNVSLGALERGFIDEVSNINKRVDSVENTITHDLPNHLLEIYQRLTALES